MVLFKKKVSIEARGEDLGGLLVELGSRARRIGQFSWRRSYCESRFGRVFLRDSTQATSQNVVGGNEG